MLKIRICNESTCNGKIIWAKGSTSAIPLDAIAPCYSIDENGNAVREKEVYVSHFCTCNRPDKFSKGANK